LELPEGPEIISGPAVFVSDYFSSDVGGVQHAVDISEKHSENFF
jgi:hypothetical protein